MTDDQFLARFPEADRPGLRRRMAVARALGWRCFRLASDAVQGAKESPDPRNAWALDGNGRAHMLSEIEAGGEEGED